MDSNAAEKEDQKAIAAGKLEVATQRLVSRYPLIGGLVATWDRKPMATDTVAIGLAEAGFVLHYSPELVGSLPLEQLEGLLHHQVRHVLHGHLLANPDEFPDEEALTIAQEVTVNEGIPEPLPEWALLLKDFPMLPLDEDTPTRYRRLARLSPEQREECAPQATVPLDDHSHWSEVQDGELYARIALDGTIDGIARRLDADLASEEREALSQMERAWGFAPGELMAKLPDSVKGGPGVDWRTVLRGYVGQMAERRPDYGRPPRRFPELLGIVPGISRASTKPTILAVIDTSSSMTDEMLGEISDELRLMCRDRRVIVVECDVEVQATYPYRPIESVKGRGGTDFRPPLERTFLRKHASDLVVYFTDGFGPAPESPPQVPVIWVLTPYGKPPAPWGKVVRMAKKGH